MRVSSGLRFGTTTAGVLVSGVRPSSLGTGSRLPVRYVASTGRGPGGSVLTRV